MSQSLPPGPDLSPSEQARLWIESPVQFWESCHREFGDVFTVQLGSLGSTVLFANPDAVRSIFAIPSHKFECHQYNEHYKYVMGSRSLLVQDGPTHRRQRRMLLPALRVEQIGRYASFIQEITSHVIGQWVAGSTISIRRACHEISFRSILRTIISDPEDPVSCGLTELYVNEILQDLGSWSPWQRFGRRQPELRRLISEQVSSRRDATTPGNVDTREHRDIMSVLVSARDDAGQPLDDEEIQDHVFTMLIAGVDPTALSIAWALHWIHRDTEIISQLNDEFLSLEPSLRPADPLQLARLPYLNAVCDESLRLYPIVNTPSGRRLTQSATIGDFKFMPGTTLLPCTYLVHRRPDIFPDPAVFRPERFIEREYAPYEYLPFGGGNRKCIGSAMAKMEMSIALGTVLQRWRLVPSTDQPAQPVRHGTLLAPSEDRFLILDQQVANH